MTSDLDPTHAYVWTWLPDTSEPVVAGILQRDGDSHIFRYGKSYLDRADSVPLYLPELPLDDTVHQPLDGKVPLCIDDAAPDSWGRTVINSKLGTSNELPPLAYLLESGSDRVGAIDFQASPDVYEPRSPEPAPLDELMHAADMIAAGKHLDPDLAQALVNGTPLGGARPKALIADNGIQYLAKFSRSTDVFPMVQSEYVAMELARRAGLDVAPVRYVETSGRSVLLVERFDRSSGGGRRRVVSAATVLSMQTLVAARHFSYLELADEIRKRFDEPDQNLIELYRRIGFNIAVGNTDDHARNHAAFVTGTGLTLTPAYDISPQPRTGEYATHPRFGEDHHGRDSRFAALVDAADVYGLTRHRGREIVDELLDTIRSEWNEVCDEARLINEQRALLMGGPFLNRFAFYN